MSMQPPTCVTDSSMAQGTDGDQKPTTYFLSASTHASMFPPSPSIRAGLITRLISDPIADGRGRKEEDVAVARTDGESRQLSPEIAGPSDLST